MNTSAPTQRLSNEAFLVFVGNAAVAMANLVVGMILVRHFVAKEVFATYSQSMFLAATLVAFVPLGLHRAIIYFFPRVESLRAFAFQTIGCISVAMLVAGAAMMLLRVEIGTWINNPSIVGAVPMIFGIMWLQNFNSVLQQILLATKRARILGIYSFSYSVCYLAAIAFAAHRNLGLKGILFLIVLLNGTQAIFTVIVASRLPGSLAKVFDFSNARAQFKYSLPLALGSFTGIIGKTIDRFVVMYLFNPVTFAIYDRGAIELPFLYQLPYSANSVLQPRLTVLYKNGNLEEFLSLWHTVVKKLALIMIPVMAFSWVIAKDLMVIVNTDAYVGSVVYFKIYLFLIPFQITVYPAILMATGHTMRIFWVTTTTLVANIAVNILLVKVFALGPIGPAISTVLVEGLKGVIFLRLIGNALKVGYSRIYPWKELKNIAIMAILAGALCYPVTLLDLDPLTTATVCLASYGLSFLALCMSFGIIHREDIADIKYMMRLSEK